MNLSSMRSRRRWPNVQSRGCRGNTPPVEMVLAYGSTCSVFKSGLLMAIPPVCSAVAMKDAKGKKWQCASAKVGWTIIFVFVASCSFIFLK